ncbi:MAG TPA: Mur ligase family protein [Candidatus Saccharimonadales bacterium]|nr:Mur ligase family protein [Candidatus Saccharimonadales bacterium]
MQTITSIDQANQLLAAYVPLVKEITGKNITLERMGTLLELAGNPHKRLRAIHVAGTSGKTSTAYFITNLLGQTGKKVGLTVSPHVDSVTERVQINGKPLDEATFCKYLSDFMDLIGLYQPTYFELLVVFAFWVFDKEKVDYAVVEVGLGGLHDGTNVLSGADKVCVITDIGLDHTNILGTTLPEIALQKAGIIHEHNVVYCLRQDDEIMQPIQDRSSEKHAQLCILSLKGENLPSELPLFQQRNWFLAKNVAEYVLERDNLDAFTKQQLNSSLKTYVPARMEIVQYKGRTVIMDGAHNPQKMTALVDSLQAKFPGQKFDVLIGMLSGKDLGTTLEILKPVVHGLTTTSFKAEQDMPRGSIEPKETTRTAKKLGLEKVNIIPGPKQAFQELVASGDAPILVTGSFFLLNYIRPLIFKA